MKRLLIADDVATNLRLVTEVLKGEYEVATAKSGEQALHIIGTFNPDIILLDIGMPKMDGYSVMDKLKANPATANIPVIFLTGDTSKEAEAKALNSGAMDFIRKPFEPMILKSRIEKALNIANMCNDLEESSRKDSLTGLWNRIYLEDYFSEIPQNETGYLCMLDLDNFKGVNDTYGHVIGDQTLIIFAEVLKELSDPTDIICRLGGDEFMIYRKGIENREKLRAVSRKVIAKIENKINELLDSTKTNGVGVSVSIGISQYPEDGKNFTELYQAADKALYFVKQNGKRGYHFFQDDCKTLADISREIAQIDMEQLKLLINEKGNEHGAYEVEYEGFKKIYHFINRCVNRTGQNVQVVLFTLNLKEGYEDDSMIAQSIGSLEHDISGLLRKADVATQYSRNQYVVILMDTTKENGMIAVNRVLEDFSKKELSKYVDIIYDIQDVESK